MGEKTEYDLCVEELRALTHKQIDRDFEWYWDHQTWPRIVFRLCGVIVVVGSLLLPVITNFQELPHQRWILTGVSLTVAILSSMSTFFKWDSTWQTRRKAALGLQSALAKWELALTIAKGAENPCKEARAATQMLFDEAFTIIGDETGKFFATVRWPAGEAPQVSDASTTKSDIGGLGLQ
jgi:hypothetical protein